MERTRRRKKKRGSDAVQERQAAAVDVEEQAQDGAEVDQQVWVEAAREEEEVDGPPLLAHTT